MTTILAFDTATELMTVAVQHGGRRVSHRGAGGAKASATLLPTIIRLLAEAGVALAGVDAIAFGRGPGAFTGLRTACSVAQGLAWGAGKPVLPIDNLRAIAEHARAGADPFACWSIVDARMSQLYAAEYAYADGRWRTLVEPMLADAATLAAAWATRPPLVVAGDGLLTFDARPAAGAQAALAPAAHASADALLDLALHAWRDGEAVDAALALPLYVRDKVAETTLERAAARAAKEQAAAAARAGNA